MRAFGQAIDVPAQGQGTMNNVTLGNDRFTYYETIGGGQGACPDADGPSGVHVAMSNTLSTPVEALELQYPLRVERYGLRLGSGGAGAHRGGDGVVRELRVLEDCRLSIISERRRHAPAGERGGAAGEAGRNALNGEPLPAKVTRELARRRRRDDRDAGRRRLRPVGSRPCRDESRRSSFHRSTASCRLPSSASAHTRAAASKGTGTSGTTARTAGRAVTLIAAEAVEAVAGEGEVSVEPPATRRNVLTRGIDVNALVGQALSHRRRGMPGNRALRTVHDARGNDAARE